MDCPKHPIYFKYRIQFLSLEQASGGFVNIVSLNKERAVEIFLKYCGLKNPKVIDVKCIGVFPIDREDPATVQPLTIQVNGQDAGTYVGEEKTINIQVPTKVSQIENDLGFVDSSALDGLEQKVTEDVLDALGDEVLTKEIVMDEFTDDDIDKENKIPSVAAVVKYILNSLMTEDDVRRIIEENT